MNASLPMTSNMRASSELSTDSPSFPPKRKGGRKPTFTPEDRRQRNRDAQAAFRERRIEYIKELEQTVELYRDKLRKLEAIRASAADECLMLRYKNSLLERLLQYKGVDVQAELKSELWKPGAVAPRVSPDAQAHKSPKRKAKAVRAMSESLPATLPTSAHYKPPVSSSPEGSEPLTPPAAAAPNPTRTQPYQSEPTSCAGTTSCKRENTRQVFSPTALQSTPDSMRKSQGYEISKTHNDFCAVPHVESLPHFLEAEDNSYSLGSLDDFDFTTDYSAITPMTFPGLTM